MGQGAVMNDKRGDCLSESDLKMILEEHAKWLDCKEEGGRADLSGSDLRGADLSGSDLREACLCKSDLYRANLHRACLRGACLYGAKLHVADLCGANLSESNLSKSDLSRANLYRANLSGANLRGTCLDPQNVPSGAGYNFTRDGEFVLGYRTRKAGHIDMYRDGRIYAADWFSTCPDTSCHPGLYLWSTLRQAIDFSGDKEMICVRTRPADVHLGGDKWRCRWFEVIGAAKIGGGDADGGRQERDEAPE